MSQKLLEKSIYIKMIASQLLEEKNILDILSKFGKPLIIWSYALDLMIDEDIDIVVQTATPRESAIAALNLFIKKEIAQKYELGDFVTYPRESRPAGYIVNLKIVYENTPREIEIWFFENISRYSEQLDRYKRKFNDIHKMKILEAKQERKSSWKNKHDKSSTTIYEEIFSKK